MRKIKFRAWDVKVGAYVIPAHTMNIHTGQISDLPDRFLLEQFTGLQDKNGKEIYEGDVISVEGFAGYIIYNSSHCAFLVLGKAWGCGCERLGGMSSLEIEVIGNIHENPDLLEAVK